MPSGKKKRVSSNKLTEILVASIQVVSPWPTRFDLTLIIVVGSKADKEEQSIINFMTLCMLKGDAEFLYSKFLLFLVTLKWMVCMCM